MINPGAGPQLLTALLAGRAEMLFN